MNLNVKKCLDNHNLKNQIVKKVVDAVYQLPTKDLEEFYHDIYKELISREDYNNLNDIKMSYEILKQELIDRGVHNV